MHALSGLSRRALVIATGAAAVTATAEARKKGKGRGKGKGKGKDKGNRKPPPPPPAPLAFAVVTVTGIQSIVDREEISCTTQGTFHHPASRQVENFEAAVEIPFVTSEEEARAKIIATVRQVIVEELALRGQVVPAELVAVTVV